MAHTLTYRRVLWPGLMLVICSVAEARESGDALVDPFASRNLTPVYGNLGVPVMASAGTAARERWQLGWSLHWASHSVRERANGLRLEYDGETRRQDLQLRGGLSDRLSLSLNLPYVHHSGGQLDALVDGWHDFWGLPDGERPTQPRDELLFLFDGDPGFALSEARSGVGDTELALDYHLIGDSRWRASGYVSYKFDSGSPRDFTGSGAASLAIGARISVQGCILESLHCHFNAGIVTADDLPVGLPGDSETLYGGLAVAWAVNDTLALIAQLEGQGAVFEQSPLDKNGAPIWGTLGLRWQPGRDWSVEAQFSEDLAVGAAPDITFRMGVSRRF